MVEFVSLIEEALIYLSERTTIPYYTKLMPRGAEFPRPEFVYLSEETLNLIAGVLVGYANRDVKRELENLRGQRRKLYFSLLRTFFPKPIDLVKVLIALNDWAPTMHPNYLIMLAEVVALNKEKMLRLDKLYLKAKDYKDGLLYTEQDKYDFVEALRAEGLLPDDAEIRPEDLDRTYPLLLINYFSILIHGYFFYELDRVFKEYVRIFGVGDKWVPNK